MPVTIGEARADAFKQALGAFASGVTVITVWDPEGQPCGMTANAFSSVSLEPRQVLVCLKRTARTHHDLRMRGRFGVNILDSEAQAIAAHCAVPGGDKRLPPRWLDTIVPSSQPPVLSDALAYLDCSVTSQVRAGTHAIVIGRVEAIGLTETGDSAPLVYFRGRYRELKAIERVTV